MENINPQENFQNPVSSDDKSKNTPEVVTDEISTSTEKTANSNELNYQETQAEIKIPDNSRSPGQDRGL